MSLIDAAGGTTLYQVDLSAVASESLTLTVANAPLPPGAPTAQVAGNRVTLSWAEPPIASAATTHYVVEAGSAPGLADLAAFGTEGVQTSVSFDNVPAGRYYVRVRAVNFTGSSGPSHEVVVDVM
jgi:hypothetical protein